LRLLDDKDNNSLVVETPGGQRMTLQDSPGTVRVEDTHGNSVTLSPSGVKVNAASTVEVSASTLEVSAGMVTVNAGMSHFSGVVKCDTLISNAVVSASYTPGAGNVW
jgi:phage baseplate assembly protein gpV